MKVFRNTKIGMRLYCIFAIIVAVLLVVAGSGLLSRVNQIKDTTELKSNYIDHLDMLKEVNVTAGNLFLSYRNYYLEYPVQENMQVRLNDINNRTDFILTNLQEYQKALESRNAPSEELNTVKSTIETINNQIIPFSQKLVGLVQAEQMEDVHQLIISKELRALRSTLQDEQISKIYNDCQASAVNILDKNIKDMESGIISVIVSVIVGFLLVVIIATLLTRSIVSPVNKLMIVSDEISKGNIDVNLPPVYKDEIGKLTGQFGVVASILSTLTAEMSKMSKEHQLGNIDARINVELFEGTFRDVAAGINDMTCSYINYMTDICGVLKEFGSGHFDVKYSALPGKKAISNEVVEELRKNLKDVEKEIGSVSKAAVNGRLSIRANSNSFNGDWRRVMEGLNSVMDAIISPIDEASAVLLSMASGDLSAKARGEYKGDFAVIKDSLNSTQTAISSYIAEISKVLSEMSGQNLDVSINRQYIGDFSLIKDSINMIVETFNRVLSHFNDSAEQVAYSSKQISDASTTLSLGTFDQVKIVDELNSSIERVASQTVKNEETAQKANILAIQAKSSAQQEAAIMKKTLEAMNEINESSSNISKIIRVIEDIAFQTNLLALNASVEAARAGEHGKGFAVVAEEVRGLASRSQLAAKDTSALIEGSIQKTAEGSRLAAETAAGLGVVVGQISEISSYIDIIAKVSKEQSTSIDQISNGISKTSEITMANTSISQENAASAEELLSQAELFRDTIAKFKLKRN